MRRVLAAGREDNCWQDQEERCSSGSGSLRNTACQEATRETAKDPKSLTIFAPNLSCIWPGYTQSARPETPKAPAIILQI